MIFCFFFSVLGNFCFIIFEIFILVGILELVFVVVSGIFREFLNDFWRIFLGFVSLGDVVLGFRELSSIYSLVIC